MLEKFNRVENPLTIIAIFAGITEVAASVALPFLQQETQQVFIWFLILFPFALVAAFFATLNFNAKVLYAPGDYRDEKHFLEALRLSDNTLQVSVTSPDDQLPSITTLRERAGKELEVSPFEGLTQPELDIVNDALKAFGEKAKHLFKLETIKGYSYGVEGEGFFLLNVFLSDTLGSGPPVESRIIKPTTDSQGIVHISIIGQNVKSSGAEEFASILTESIETSIERRRKQSEREKKRQPNKAMDSDKE
jgi:hypothetical protein